jgi:hypothetical protein
VLVLVVVPGEELLTEGARIGDQPAHDITAEDIEDHVQVEVRPLGRSAQLGDVPGPDLVGCNRQQLGLGVRRMDELVAPLPRATGARQQPVHGAHRAKVAALVEQRGMHGRRRGVQEPLAVERIEQRLVLQDVQGDGW